MVKGLLLALVADGAGDAAPLAAAESRPVALGVVRAIRTDLINDVFDGVGVANR